MPTQKRRINLSVSDEIYARLVDYRERYGIPNDSAACMQLIVQQLNNLEQAEAMMKFIQNSTVEQLSAMSAEGFRAVKAMSAGQDPQK